MKKLLLTLTLLATVIISCQKEIINNPTLPSYDMEGKWTNSNNNQSTMYIYENGVIYTYYCTTGNCDSLYNTFVAGDANEIPGTNNYTFINDTLRVDLNFGNRLVTPITFECDGGKAIFTTSGYSLIKLGSGCQ